MVGTLVRLQWALSIRQLQTSVAARVLAILAGLGAVSIGVSGMFGLSLLRDDPALRGPVTTLALGFITFAWPVLSLIMFGSGDNLDIRAFALLPVRGRQLIPGMLAAAFIGFGGPLTLLLDIGFVAAWSRTPGQLVLAIVGAVLGTAICVLAQRCVSTAVSGLMRRRRVREFATVGVFVLVMAFSFGLQLLNLHTQQDADAVSNAQFGTGLTTVAHVVSWTPFGWPWAGVASAAAGHAGVAAAQFGLAVVLIALLAWIWAGQVSRGLVSPLESGSSGERVRSGGLLDRLLPDTAAGAIARRDIHMFRREPRRLTNIIASLLMPVYFVIIAFMFSQTGGNSGLSSGPGHVFLALVPAALAWIVSSIATTDICFDGSALGTQILTGATGRDDRWGRVQAMLLIFGTLQVVFIVVFAAMGRRWDVLPGTIGLCAALLLGGLGAGSWASSIWQYPLPPSYNLFNRGARASTGSIVGWLISTTVQILVALPTIALVIAGLFTPWLQWLALPVGIGSGLALLFWGVRAGARRLDATWPEVLATVTWKG